MFLRHIIYANIIIDKRMLCLQINCSHFSAILSGVLISFFFNAFIESARYFMLCNFHYRQ